MYSIAQWAFDATRKNKEGIWKYTGFIRLGQEILGSYLVDRTVQVFIFLIDTFFCLFPPFYLFPLSEMEKEHSLVTRKQKIIHGSG